MSITTSAPDYPALAEERRAAVDTKCAAWHLGRSPVTLRMWAYKDTGPLRPIKINNGRLAWPVAEIRKLLGVAP